MLESVFNRRDSPTQMFPCEYCGIFKNIHFEKHLQTAASHLINIAKIIVKTNI